MRRLTIIVLALAAIYGAYWVFGASMVERTATSRAELMRLEGWKIDYDDLSTRGFPSRFDTTVTALDVEIPSGDLAWSAPFVQALSLAYKPNEVILALPESQTITLGGVPFTLMSQRLRASAAVTANADLDLARFTAEVGAMSANSRVGMVFSLTKAIVALRPAADMPLTYDAFVDVDDFVLPLQLRQVLDPKGNYPVTLSQITVDAAVTTDRKLDRHALMNMAMPQLDAIKLNGINVVWGPLLLRGSGAVTIDGMGVPSGKITLEAQNWREMVRMAVSAGFIEQGVSRTLENMGALLGGASNSISLPVSFQNGMMLIGPVPVGPAPRFR